jgi:glutamyl-Q tRNA(Asp) synthetase
MQQGEYRGRFAPSPSGPLHFGSLVSALASYVDARQHNGRWLMRIDNVDQTRCIPGMDKKILLTLEGFGFTWDETIRYQSQQIATYNAAIEQLNNKDLLYYCACSRKAIAQTAHIGVEGAIYPDTCRYLGLTEQAGHALRICTTDQLISFTDGIYGKQQQQIHQEIGDFVLRRADGLHAYQLAVVVDDHIANITHVVRGADLLTSTPRQIYLQQQLGYATPSYLHIPLVLNQNGKKMSKSDAAHPVDQNNPTQSLLAAWQFLRQNMPPDNHLTLDEFWRWAIQHWDPGRV